ncbi:MAG TPA: hypothetical protein VFY14_10890 [Streptomyces sp.]|nr:hypothetical protein [Streptomyces sp.]
MSSILTGLADLATGIAAGVLLFAVGTRLANLYRTRAARRERQQRRARLAAEFDHLTRQRRKWVNCPYCGPRPAHHTAEEGPRR